MEPAIATLAGGPFDGSTMTLRRTPAFLRVYRVYRTRSILEAVEQIDGLPPYGVDVVVYRLTLSRVDAKKRKSVSYEYIADQPSQEIAHSRPDWARWMFREIEKHRQE